MPIMTHRAMAAPLAARRSHERLRWIRRMLPVGPWSTISVMVSWTSFGSDTRRRLDPDAQHQPAHAQLVAVVERPALGALAVHQRPVGAAQVLHERPRAL